MPFFLLGVWKRPGNKYLSLTSDLLTHSSCIIHALYWKRVKQYVCNRFISGIKNSSLNKCFTVLSLSSSTCSMQRRRFTVKSRLRKSLEVLKKCLISRIQKSRFKEKFQFIQQNCSDLVLLLNRDLTVLPWDHVLASWTACNVM